MLTRRYQLLLLAVLVLAAYYPVVLSEFSRIDDSQMADQFRSIEGWDWRGIFIPKAVSGLYYRPLLVTSFFIDKLYFGLLPGVMHLENAIIHLLNAVLVYFLTVNLLSPAVRMKSYLPLLAAILFGLHPVNTESVNWISGRTDLLSESFILMSALALVCYHERTEKRYLALAICSFVGGVLAKETALAFLPGAILIMTAARPATGLSNTASTGNNRFYKLMLVLGVIVVALSFYLLRSIAFTSNASRISITLHAILNDWNHAFFVVLRAFGFYLKKLVVPYPLNFALVEVDPLYELLAVPLIALCIYIAMRRTLISSIFTAGMFLIAPSFLLAFGQVAWTPYAERYVYIPSAFFIVASTLYVSTVIPDGRARLVRNLTAILIALMFVMTFSRCLLWQDDLKFIKDTVKKSPLAKDIKIPYASLLADRGEFTEALRQLELGRSLPSLEYDERFELGIARTYYLQGRVDEAIAMSEQVLRQSKNTSVQALKYLTAILDEKLWEGSSRLDNKLLFKKRFTYNMQLYEINHDLHVLYNAGVAAAAMGEKNQAITSLQKVYNELPADDYYKWYAKTKIKKLTNTLK